MQQALRLSELCSLVEDVLSTNLADIYWVRAEIASLMVKSGHAYLELVEKSDTGLPAAKLRATCWTSIYTMLSAYFREETGMSLQAGIQVLVAVEINYHAVYGLSLNIVEIDPSYTIGDLARQRQQTIQRLQQEGIYDMQHQLELPRIIRHLAVISSDSAAGYEDFVHQLQSAKLNIKTTLFGASMQGERAEQSIVNALGRILDEDVAYDAVVIIRGGGATTDLSCFDTYNLCCHAAQYPLPILTGIGHTRDISILDMVAYAALKTPTAVAAYLTDRVDALREQLRLLRERLARTAERQILIRRHQLDMLRQRLESCNPERIYNCGYSLLTNAKGEIVHSIQDVQAGECIQTHLQDGTIKSVVV